MKIIYIRKHDINTTSLPSIFEITSGKYRQITSEERIYDLGYDINISKTKIGNIYIRSHNKNLICKDIFI